MSTSSKTPYYGPNEDANTIFLERTFLAGDFVCGTGYGIQAMLFFSCTTFLWRTRKSRGSTSLLLIGYMCLLFSIETIFSVVQARTVQVIYIDNRNYPKGPWQYFLDTQYLPINVMFYATLFVLTFLSDLLVLWRCWIIWGGTGKGISYAVCAFPALMILASFVMGTLWTLQSSQPGLSLYSALPMAYGTSYYVISLSVNIVLTALISARLLWYRRRAISVLRNSGIQIEEAAAADHGAAYVSLLTIMVESAALYSVFAFIFIITYAVNNPINQIFLAVASSAQQIAGYLIIYRLADGRAWNPNTTTEKERSRLPTLRFRNTQNSNFNTQNTGVTTASSILETPIDGLPLFSRYSDPRGGALSRISSRHDVEKDEKDVTNYTHTVAIAAADVDVDVDAESMRIHR